MLQGTKLFPFNSLAAFFRIYLQLVCMPLTHQRKYLAFLVPFYNLSSACIRYNDGEESICHFRVTLVDHVLVKLLWKDFLTAGTSRADDIINLGKATVSLEENVSESKKVDMLNMKYPMPYLQELGKCFIEILLGIFILDINVLSVFIEELQDNCMGALEQAVNVDIVERIILFMFLLEKHAVLKGAIWPLAYIVGPMLGKSFSLIKSSVS